MRRTGRSISKMRRLRLERLQSRLVLDASLSGAVFIDLDGDSQRDAGEFGVPGAVVTLTGSDGAGTSVNRSLLTRSDGTYTFDAVSPGTYQIAERQPRAVVNGLEGTLAPGSTASDRYSNIVLADGQHLANFHFGEQYLRPEFTNIRWLFASSQPLHRLMREAVARGEELAGETTLATEIRAGGNEVPEDINDPPVANNNSYQVDSDQTLSVTPNTGVLGNDTDPDGDNLTAQIVALPTHGSLTLNANGAFFYTPQADFHGVDTFTYQASDGASLSNTATVTITVNEVPDVPANAMPDFTLTDVNSHSETHNQGVSPRDYLEQVSGWYFGHST